MNRIKSAKLIGRNTGTGKPIDLACFKRIELELSDGSRLDISFDESDKGWIEIMSNSERELSIRPRVTNVIFIGHVKGD